jgi:hypothetical protein
MDILNPSNVATPNTFGPDFDIQQDGNRLMSQLDTIASLMYSAQQAGQWLTLYEIESATGYPSASISAQLRHLRKAKFGSHEVRKRRRHGQGGTWEYMVTR